MDRYEFKGESRDLLERSIVPFAIYQFIDKRVVTLIISDGFCRLFHYEDKAKAYYDMDHNMYQNAHPDDVARIAEAAYRFATEGGKYDVVYRTKKNDGGSYTVVHSVGEHFITETGVTLAQVWYTDEGLWQEDADMENSGVKGSFEKVINTENERTPRLFDHLTGLPGMTYFMELADAGCRKIRENGKVPAFLFLDLSGMKSFNRKHGFVEGDKLLRSFAKLLEKYFSSGNCSRFVQDHFVVYVESDIAEDKIRGLFEEWQKSSMRPLPIRAGVYIADLKNVDVIEACDNAKSACDVLRNTYVSSINYYDQGMQDDIDRREYIISNIDRAIEEKWIKVYYQPIVRAVNGKVCDEEALARWIDPVRGFMSPADFISILEESHLIYKLDLYVVDQIALKIRDIKARGFNAVPQSVNLSRTDFEECDIVEEIRRRMDDAGLDHSLLTIEITESMIASDFEYMKEQVNRFRDLGFRVWMDDFGSGYSSLDVLQDLQFDLIKFDMRFLHQLENGVNGKIILTELMRMATSLGLETICEGVETVEHVDFLSDIGCCKLQGYYYSKPLPYEQIPERCKNNENIGFEAPEESPYYDTLGKINLYDLEWVMTDGSVDIDRFYDSIPMVIMELTDDAVRIVRSNLPYKEFSDRSLERNIGKEFEKFDTIPEHHRNNFLSYMIQCANSGNRVMVHEKFPGNITVHTFMRRVAVNPLKGTRSVAVAILSVTDDTLGATYENIANSLAADYFELFYVDLKTEKYILYSSDRTNDDFKERSSGEDFFAEGRRKAVKMVYRSDRADFVAAFTRENILNSLDEQGRFEITYRLLQKGKPIYVSMKAMRMSKDADHMIVGIRNVNAQMKQREALERIKREQISSSRICALVNNYLCLYTVNIKDESYYEFGNKKAGGILGFGREGTGFFDRCIAEGKRIVYGEDYKDFVNDFSRDKVLESIKKDGIYAITYRLNLRGNVFKATLRAALVKEADGDKLIVGLYKEDPD